ncbi:MAG TPA: M1 family aminopeptidase [Caulobacteraceae bacterium]|nr:M1 family aminopeptidase [Caulobacteraceae bacterium]
MFFKIAAFEFRYQLRQPVFWIAAVIFTLLPFGIIASTVVQLGGTGNVHMNSPFVIAIVLQLFATIYMFVTPAVVGNVILRDDETGFGGILRSTRVSKFDYLYGRFTGAFAALCLNFLAVPVGLLLGSLAPWVDKDTLGPFVAQHYLVGYAVIALPIIFLTSALFFTLTTVTRSLVWTYVGVIALFAARTIAGFALGRPELLHIAALIDPFGGAAFGAATRYWTAFERNTMLPPLAGDVLVNKVVWLMVAVAALAAAFPLFRFQAGAVANRRARRTAELAEQADAAPAPQEAPTVMPRPVFNRATAWAQLWARTKLDAKQVFLSPGYFVLLALAAALSLSNLWFSLEISLYGGRIYPVTVANIAALAGIFTFFTQIIAVYFSGELVWRESERKTHEIIDATPVADWMFVGPKTLAISLVLVSTFIVGIVVAMLFQTAKGFFSYEIGEYLLWYVLPNAIDVALIAVLAVFVQVLSPHKFVGWAVMIAYVIVSTAMVALGLEHNLYNYGSGPAVPLSDLNGQGHYWIGAYWFRLYWGAFAVILLVVSYALWRRGTETRFLPRLKRLPLRLRGTAGVLAAAALAVFIASGVYIFINTNVWNVYRSHLDVDRMTADYEKKYLRYENLPQPKVDFVKLAIQIWPHRTWAEATGGFVIQNRTNAPISVLHVRFDRGTKVGAVYVPNATLVSNDRLFNYRIYRLDQPMLPGETRAIGFVTRRGQRGFRNNGATLDIMDNGTFLNSNELAPFIGMDRSELLQDRAKRRKYGLPADLGQPALATPGADMFNDLRKDSDWVRADLTVTTDADQTPIAPGYTVSDVTANGRRTVHTVTDSPILNFFSAQSGRYAISTVNYKGVAISVYYDPKHPWNVRRIQRAMENGLDYDQANFSPYQFHQVRVLEFPTPQGTFAESFANTIPWSEGIFFIADNRDPDLVDMVTYVGSHELGHQWWAHQVIGANEQGGAMLSETLAQYTAAMAMKRLYGPFMMRKFLRFELDSYLRSRGGSVLEEEPLDRVETQDYVYYRKGSLAMYRLQDEIGEANVDRALRQLLHDFAFKGPPYPTTVDLIKDFRAVAPADKQQLITDLFQKITLYDLKAKKAVWRKRADGAYDLALTVDARKVYANGQGKETATPMNETVDVGAFDVEPASKGYGAKDVIAIERVPIHSGLQTIHLVTSRAPKYAGIDPFNTMITRDSEATITKAQAG